MNSFVLEILYTISDFIISEIYLYVFLSKILIYLLYINNWLKNKREIVKKDNLIFGVNFEK